METSASGNFHTTDPLVFPITAEIRTGGRIVPMPHAVESGSCNSCHSCEGEVGQKLTAN